MKTCTNVERLLSAIKPHNAYSYYANLPEEDRANPEIALHVVRFDGLAILYTPLSARTPEVCEAARTNEKRFATVYIEQAIVRDGTVTYPRLVHSQSSQEDKVA